jgi:hypothetical protein
VPTSTGITLERLDGSTGGLYASLSSGNAVNFLEPAPYLDYRRLVREVVTEQPLRWNYRCSPRSCPRRRSWRWPATS